MIIRLLLALILMCGAATCGEIVVQKGTTTSLDKYFEYEFDGISPNATLSKSTIDVQGRVKNVSGQKFGGVQVTITLKDENGEFIGRNWNYAEPEDIEPGDSAFIRAWIECGEKKPGIVEWAISKAYPD